MLQPMVAIHNTHALAHGGNLNNAVSPNISNFTIRLCNIHFHAYQIKFNLKLYSMQNSMQMDTIYHANQNHQCIVCVYIYTYHI